MTEYTIPFDKAKELLRIEDNRTLNSFISQAKISITSNQSGDPLAMVLEKSALGQALRIKQLPEKFLIVEEVAELLHIAPSQVISLCSSNLLPHYKLNPNRGSRKLFVEEEVLASQTAKIILEQSLEAWAINWRLIKYQELIEKLLLLAERGDFFSAKSHDIVSSLLFQKISPRDLGKKYNMTSEGIRYIFETKLSGLIDGIGNLTDKLKEIKVENGKLRKENWELKAKLKAAAEVQSVASAPSELFGINVTELDFPVRALHCFANAGIENLGQLVGYTKSQLLLMSTFGKKTLTEVNETLAEKGIVLDD